MGVAPAQMLVRAGLMTEFCHPRLRSQEFVQNRETKLHWVSGKKMKHESFHFYPAACTFKAVGVPDLQNKIICSIVVASMTQSRRATSWIPLSAKLLDLLRLSLKLHDYDYPNLCHFGMLISMSAKARLLKLHCIVFEGASRSAKSQSCATWAMPEQYSVWSIATSTNFQQYGSAVNQHEPVMLAARCSKYVIIIYLHYPSAFHLSMLQQQLAPWIFLVKLQGQREAALECLA